MAFPDCYVTTSRSSATFPVQSLGRRFGFLELEVFMAQFPERQNQRRSSVLSLRLARPLLNHMKNWNTSAHTSICGSCAYIAFFLGSGSSSFYRKVRIPYIFLVPLAAKANIMSAHREMGTTAVSLKLS